MSLTGEEFDALFDSFRHTAFRLEAGAVYAIDTEDEDFAAWREGRPQPERSVRTEPWLARIAVSTATEGKQWTRTRVFDDPLTEYQRYELGGLVESHACGDHTRIAWRSDVGDVGPDFWLLDADWPSAHAVVMRYDDDGQWLAAELTYDPETLAQLVAIRDHVLAVSVSLNEWMATSWSR
ncbi:MAG: hypothetical protein H0X35_03405 [Pseudonocardiales bacterium]|nr:hypothetical protein [Pseudonocardiales bacterium]